jgi:YD repeat-containing protein
MNRLASLLVLVTATGGCVADPGDGPTPASPDPVDQNAWPCGSTTAWPSTGRQTEQTYAWDAAHNLVFKDDGNGTVYTWTYDLTGTIVIRETMDGDLGHEMTTREVDDGRVLTEHHTKLGEPDTVTTYRYDAGRLVEKHTTGDGNEIDLTTTVLFPAPDTRVEVYVDNNHPPGGNYTTKRTWIGEPWTEMQSVERNVMVEVVRRRLDADGREVHLEHRPDKDSAPTGWVETERAASGAPLREKYLYADFQGSTHTTQYRTTCSK